MMFAGLELSDLSFGWVRESGRWQLLLLAIGYLVVVQATNLIFVTGPAAHRVLKDLEEEKQELALSDVTERGEIGKLLDAGFKARKSRRANLTRVITARRYLHASQRLRTRYDNKHHVALARLSSQRLKKQAIGWPEPRRSEAQDVAVQIDGVLKRLNTLRADARPADNEGPAVESARTELAVLTTEALKLWYENDDEALERNADAQRRTLWLVYAGVAAILVVGTYGPRVPMLFGGVGGFLAPVIQVRRKRLDPSDYRTSWEILMLGPVAGALSAYAGLLVLQFLSDANIKVLGDVFQDRFTNPHTALSKALALLLGYSATLFAFLAGKAVEAVKPQEEANAAAVAPPVLPALDSSGTTPTAESEAVAPTAAVDGTPTVGEDQASSEQPMAPSAIDPALAEDPLAQASSPTARRELEESLLMATDNGPRHVDGEQPRELTD